MKPKELVSSLITALNGRLTTPVHTSGIEETRPVPSILVDGLDITHNTHHNSNFAGHEWNNGQVTKEVYRHYYEARIDLVVRDDDEIGAYSILGNLQQALSMIERDPCKYLHNDVNDMGMLSSGQITYQFHEPTETEINQSILIDTFYDSEYTDFDAIESISETYDFN